jgi:hypothetical protein
MWPVGSRRRRKRKRETDFIERKSVVVPSVGASEDMVGA